MQSFARTIGIDYSGAETPTASNCSPRFEGVMMVGGFFGL